MQAAYHSKTIQNNTINYRTQMQYNTKQPKRQTQLFTKFYDMDSHALGKMCGFHTNKRCSVFFTI